MPGTLIDDIREINRRVCYDLWSIVTVNQQAAGLSPRLILPKKRDKSIRISEQESRILYCSVLNRLGYYYSIETPTNETYSFTTGSGGRSASSDLSLYVAVAGKFQKVANVEFKAHNSNINNIRKDIEKLIREPNYNPQAADTDIQNRIVGNWFHTIANIDSGTLVSLFKKFMASFIKCEDNVTSQPVSIFFTICILDKHPNMRRALQKHFTFDKSLSEWNNYVDDFFSLNYQVSRGRITINDAHNWAILKSNQ